MSRYWNTCGTGNLYFGGGQGPPGPPGPSSGGVLSIVSVFNWIPSQYHAAILAGTLSAAIDLAPYIQTAINEIGCRQLYFEQSPTPGVSAIYNVGSPLVNTSNDLTIQGGTRATIRAIADLDTNNDGRGAIIYSPNRRLKVTSIVFDLNNKKGNGIFIDRCSFPAFDLITSNNTLAGYAGIRGGSILYLNANRCNFLGSGRAADFQKGWELIATGSYYGINDSLMSFCKAFCKEGWRICGGVELLQCSVEAGIDQPTLRNEARGPRAAAWVLGEEIGSQLGFNISLDSCYAELALGTAATLKCFYTYSNVACHFKSGEFFGVSASLADSTWLTAADFATTTIEGNPNVKRWQNAFEGSYSGGSTNYILTQFAYIGLDGSVTEIFKPGTGVQPGEVNRSVGNWGDISNQKGGIQYARPIFGTICQVNPNGTPGDDSHKINLGQARSFLLQTSPAATVDLSFLLNLTRNQQFSFEFSNGNTTLSNAAFNLFGGADKTYAAGDIVLFQVDTNGIIRQVGGNA